MSEARVIVARVDIDRWEEQSKEMVPGSSIDTCASCQDPVWLSPEGHVFAYESGVDADIICTDCHIYLEIERHKQDKDAMPIPTQPVPGTPVDKEVVKSYQRDIAQKIKEGLEDG